MPPDQEVALTDGTRTRVAELLHPARGVFITASDDSEARRLVTGWADRAWAAPGGSDLSGALGRWFGSARVVTPTVATSSRGQ
jgi:hypothetical protein